LKKLEKLKAVSSESAAGHTCVHAENISTRPTANQTPLGRDAHIQKSFAANLRRDLSIGITLLFFGRRMASLGSVVGFAKKI
jgi:hypothetical protein